MKKRLFTLALALALILSLTTGTSAADTRRQVTAYLNYNITVTYNGEPRVLTDVNGKQVYPVSYEGTTYVPIRAIGNLLGLKVDWEQDTRTVLLDSPAEGETITLKNAVADDPARKGIEEIKPYIEPGITVKYNGEAQEMKTVAGVRVYPMLYNGTTYLPVRAVSNMLDIEVDWEQATQTVVLTASSPSITIMSGSIVIINGKAIDVSVVGRDGLIEALGAVGIPPAGADAILAQMQVLADADNLATGWAELDGSTANKGYIRVKFKEELSGVIEFTVKFNSEIDGNFSKRFCIKAYELEKWLAIPLFYGNGNYEISVNPYYKTVDEIDKYGYGEQLRINVSADFDLADLALLSNILVDYENAPETRAKAQEITKGCKTDAEKITAVFNYVASNIRYDHALYEKDVASEVAREHAEPRDLALDHILESKTGVCQHYAVLMAGMLRSLGIPCKVVSGDAYTGKIINGYSRDGWESHAWVSVSPDTQGLNKAALGAGTEPDGWIRLDPTWGNTASGRAEAAVDKNHKSEFCY